MKIIPNNRIDPVTMLMDEIDDDAERWSFTKIESPTSLIRLESFCLLFLGDQLAPECLSALLI